MLSSKIDAWQDILNYEVVILTVNQDNKPFVYPPTNKFKHIDLGLDEINSYNFLQIFKFLNKVKKYIEIENPNLVISTLTGLPALLLPFINRKVKKALEIHTYGGVLVTKSWKYKWFFLNKYDYVILLSNDEKRFYKLKNIKVIPNFLKISERKVNYNDRVNTIVSAGRISEQKNFFHLVKVWEKLFQKYPDWRLEIYGDGDKNILQKLISYIKDKEIKRIEFKHAVSDINEVFNKSSIFALTSLHECFPMVLLECKENMLPVISYDLNNGPRSIISNDGVLVEHNNIEKFAEELAALMKDEERRKTMSENAFKNRLQFSSEVVMKKWNELI